MAKFAGFENSLLKIMFNATAYATFCDNAGSSPATNLYVALHTALPASDDQTSNETSYTSYARVAVARTTGGWTVSTNTVVPAAAITFPACSGGSATITHWSVGTLSTGTGKILYAGTVSPNISVSTPVQPILSTSTSIAES